MVLGVATSHLLQFTRLDRLARLCAYGAALATGLAAFADLDWRFELLTPFRLHIAVAMALLAVALLLLRRPGHAVLAAMVLVVNTGAVLDRDEPVVSGAGLGNGSGVQLRLVTFNVLDTNGNHPGIVDWLRGSEADVVVLIEVGPSAAGLADALADIYGFRHADTLDQGRFGTMILSRHPLSDGVVIWPGDGAYPAVKVKVIVDGRYLSVIGVHPPPPMGRLLTEARDTYLAEVGAFAGKVGTATVLAGDFNAPPWSYAYRNAVRAAGFQAGPRTGATWPVWLGPFGLPIDHVIAGRGASVVAVDTGPDLGSDHLPVVADLIFS